MSHDLLSACAYRPRGSLLRYCRLGHARAQKVSTALWENVTVNRTCLVTHAAREVPQPKAQPCAIKILGYGTRDDIFQLADTRILTPAKTEILPRRMTWADHL